MGDEPCCMMCSSPLWDRDEIERRYEAGQTIDVVWTYCRACDCWTEHPEPEPATPAPDATEARGDG